MVGLYFYQLVEEHQLFQFVARVFFKGNHGFLIAMNTGWARDFELRF
jgi:hypothetical protein